MTQDAVVWLSFSNDKEATEIAVVIGKVPNRSCSGKNGSYLIQYDLKFLIERRSFQTLVQYLAKKGKSRPSIVIDLPILFPNRLFSKGAKLPKKVLSFAFATGARIDLSIYRSE